MRNYESLMIAVDAQHIEGMSDAIQVGLDLAKLYDSRVTFVGVSSNTPGPAGHNPAEFAEALDAVAARMAAAQGVAASAHAVIAPDPAADLEGALLRAIEDTGADLVVMASHVPGLAEHIWPSNGGKLAGHAKVSVFLVRPSAA